MSVRPPPSSGGRRRGAGGRIYSDPEREGEWIEEREESLFSASVRLSVSWSHPREGEIFLLLHLVLVPVTSS